MFSVLGASVFVPFLPMLPIQILANNLLYDLSQTRSPPTTSTPSRSSKPRPWDIKAADAVHPVHRPVLVDLRLHDLLHDAVRVRVLEHLDAEAAAHSASLFQTGWFVESLLTQTLIIHIIRTNKIPFLQSRASWPVLGDEPSLSWRSASRSRSRRSAATSASRAIPPLYWPLLVLTLVCYMVLTQAVKIWLLRRRRI